MVFLGIDLGWINGATGLAALEWSRDALRLKDLALAGEHSDVLRWIREQAEDGPAMIAIDAPTIIRNAAGQRPGERQLNAAFRKFGLGCHPANLGRPFAAKTTNFSGALEREGYRHAPDLTPREPGRYQIEVFPHATIVQLFGLDYRLAYKKGAVAERVAQLTRLRRMLYSLRRADPPCVLTRLPAIPPSGIARKHVEDRLDAILCAYTGAHYWFWGSERNAVFGDGESGFLVVPEPSPVPLRSKDGSA
jgi:predicted RNase H-like nuclease